MRYSEFWKFLAVTCGETQLRARMARVELQLGADGCEAYAVSSIRRARLNLGTGDVTR